MGKTLDLVGARSIRRGLASRAHMILGRGSSTGILLDPDRVDQNNPIETLASAAPGPSILLEYELAKGDDAGAAEIAARSIVGKHGAVRRDDGGHLYVILYHMDSADGAMVLSQFGKALRRSRPDLEFRALGRAIRVGQ